MNRFCYLSIIVLLLKVSYCSGFENTVPVDETKKERMHLSYNGGGFAPFGLMTGLTFAKGHGFYLNGRLNHHAFKKSQYYFDGSAISDHSLNWTYDDVKVYSRWEANAGGIFKIYQNEKGMGFKMYLGAGILRPRYLYSFKKVASKSVGHVWVEYKEISKFTYNTELGICFFFNESLNIQLGLSSLTKKYERMLTFGIGTGLYKRYN